MTANSSASEQSSSGFFSSLYRFTLVDLILWAMRIAVVVVIVAGTIGTLRKGTYTAAEWFDFFMFGLTIGGIYALIALGYTMVYGILRLINFAHGDITMFGTFVAYFCISRWHLPIYLVFMITIGATAALGVLVEKIAYKPLRAAPRISLLITAVGVS